jgi:hypothetical protein
MDDMKKTVQDAIEESKVMNRRLRAAFIAAVRDGTIVDSGKRRPGKDGQLKIVWVLRKYWPVDRNWH